MDQKCVEPINEKGYNIATGKEKPKSLADTVTHSQDYKDRLFCDLFGDPENKERILSLFNAVNGTDYTNAEDIEVKTLKHVVYAKMRNDVSFLFDCSLNLYEQQSTVNPNMPLRGFLYFAESLGIDHWAGNSKIYGKSLLKIPAPKYIVFYNGTTNRPEQYDLKLSDAFQTESPGYEWTAHVININYGSNVDIMDRCNELKGYSILIEKIRTYNKEGNDMKNAVTKAVDDCIKEDILADYLRKNRQSAISSLLSEYNEELTMAYLRDEAKEEGAITLLVEMVNDEELSLEKAAKHAKLSISDFLDETRKYGQTILEKFIPAIYQTH